LARLFFVLLFFHRAPGNADDRWRGIGARFRRLGSIGGVAHFWVFDWSTVKILLIGTIEEIRLEGLDGDDRLPGSRKPGRSRRGRWVGRLRFVAVIGRPAVARWGPIS
jgi:hypothetical protein